MLATTSPRWGARKNSHYSEIPLINLLQNPPDKFAQIQEGGWPF